MAIDKAVENEFGAEFTYHKLREVRIINDDNIGVQLTLTVESWINKEARIAGKQPTVRQCIIQGADFAMTPFYALLKAKFTDFSGGTDDFDNAFKEAEGQKPVPVFTVQTAHGDLIGRWRETAETEPETKAETEPEAQAEIEADSDESEAGANTAEENKEIPDVNNSIIK